MKLVGNSHLVAGGPESIDVVLALVGKEGINTENNSDIYIRTYTHFGVDEARELRERTSTRGLEGRRVFIVVATGMTTEAQNALLKTLEEPAANFAYGFT